MPRTPARKNLPLEDLVRLLPLPLHPLEGPHATELALPDSIVCFYHHSASDMNRPADGRALHHRYVLILALETSVTVCVDDQALRLNEGEGLLVLPFQFHNYIQPAKEKITWLFVTFEMVDGRSLESLRFRTFALSPVIRQLVRDLVLAYMAPNDTDLTIIVFALLLARIKQADPLRRRLHQPPVATELIKQVNQLAQREGGMPNAKEIASSLGISESHLRARFRTSCGVSLGRHLRWLRLEKARGLLQLSNSRVSEIAELCGFNSIFSFSRTFRAGYGISPLTYRKGGRLQRKK